MILYDKEGNKYQANKCKAPTFNNVRGRTWDYERKMLDGQDTKFHLDTTWGWYYYFQIEFQWYKVPIAGDATKGIEGVEPIKELFTKIQ